MNVDAGGLIDLGVVRDPHVIVVALLRQIGTDLAPVFGHDFHAGDSVFESPWHSSFYTYTPCCYVLCADSGWLFKSHHLLMEFQFLHDDNWGHSAVIRDPRAAVAAKRRLADFATARGSRIEVSERYDLPTWGGGDGM